MKTAKKVIASIALLAIGYAGGAYLGFPSSDKSQMQGDVSKVNVSEDPDVLAMRDLLAEDEESQKMSIISTAFLSSRIDVLDSLAEAGVKATDGQKSLKMINDYFTSLKRKTTNAKANLDKLMEVNEKTIKGEKVNNFEEVSNNALLSFVVLDNAISNDAVGDMLDYTREIDNQNAADAIAGWMVYCSQNAEDKGNSNDIAMWQKVYSTLSNSLKQKYNESKTALSHDLATTYTEKLNENQADFKDIKINANDKVVKSGNVIGKMISASCNQNALASK